MTDNIGNTTCPAGPYTSPQVKVIYIKSRGVLCQSTGNESMPERDYRDGGFGEV